jgi:hypothetical protein
VDRHDEYQHRDRDDPGAKARHAAHDERREYDNSGEPDPRCAEVECFEHDCGYLRKWFS